MRTRFVCWMCLGAYDSYMPHLCTFQCHKTRTFYCDVETDTNSHMELTFFTIQIYFLLSIYLFDFTSLDAFSFYSPALVREQHRHIQYLYDSVAIVIESITHNHVKWKHFKSIEIVRTKPTEHKVFNHENETRPNCEQHFHARWHNSHWKL